MAFGFCLDLIFFIFLLAEEGELELIDWTNLGDGCETNFILQGIQCLVLIVSQVIVIHNEKSLLVVADERVGFLIEVPLGFDGAG